MTENTAHGVVRDLLPAAPPVTVGGMTVLGMPLPDVVLILTIVYTAAQLVIVMPKAIAVLKKWFRK